MLGRIAIVDGDEPPGGLSYRRRSVGPSTDDGCATVGAAKLAWIHHEQNHQGLVNALIADKPEEFTEGGGSSRAPRRIALLP
jgi:hypothetical protein